MRAAGIGCIVDCRQLQHGAGLRRLLLGHRLHARQGSPARSPRGQAAMRCKVGFGGRVAPVPDPLNKASNLAESGCTRGCVAFFRTAGERGMLRVAGEVASAQVGTPQRLVKLMHEHGTGAKRCPSLYKARRPKRFHCPARGDRSACEACGARWVHVVSPTAIGPPASRLQAMQACPPCPGEPGSGSLAGFAWPSWRCG